MARKKPFKVDPPTKNITIPGVSSDIADQFNRLISKRSDITGLSKAQIFEEMVLNERRKDVGDHMVQITIEIYNEKQERMIRLNESFQDGPK